MIEKQKHRVIGLMSGTSLDGIDIVDVIFTKNTSEHWLFEVLYNELVPFEEVLLNRLESAFRLPAEELIRLSSDLGRFYAEIINRFIERNRISKEEIDFISSHGQTIFHQPELGYTLQIGNGPEISVNTQLPSVVDFRTKDVALGGNGAPFIPVADFLLFNKYADSFLNLGGFSNYSFKENGIVRSFDICPVNIVVNNLVKEVGLDYDKNGEIGSKGKVSEGLLKKLNELEFYNLEGPKSLGWEWVEEKVIPLLSDSLSLEDKVRTFYEHIAYQIGRVVNEKDVESVLVTGGGAKNTFLIERIRAFSTPEIILPNHQVIDFKEAIGFAFLGLLRWLDEVNVWSSVTGAKSDSSSGVIYRP